MATAIVTKRFTSRARFSASARPIPADAHVSAAIEGRRRVSRPVVQMLHCHDVLREAIVRVHASRHAWSAAS